MNWLKFVFALALCAVPITVAASARTAAAVLAVIPGLGFVHR